MSKVTSKFQVTLPQKIADAYSIRPGDEIDWVAAGDIIRVIPPGKALTPFDAESRLRLFDQSTERQRNRVAPCKETADRGWTREDLYSRGSSH